MANIPANVILIWTGTNATIPSGWSRVTDLDDKFPKAWGAENPNTTGGSTTHTHTSPAHTHSIDSHTHTGTIPAGHNPSNEGWRKQGSGYYDKGDHTHSITTNAPSATTSSSTAHTYGSCSNDPPYYGVIFIKPTGANASLVSGICSYYKGVSVPADWFYCNGSNSTPDLRNKYLKGATTGSDAGTTGGSTTNVHSLNHGHTLGSHTHTFTSSSYNSLDGGQSSNWVMINYAHSHSGTTGASSSNTINDNNTSLTTTETVEPAYKKIGIIKNNGGKVVLGLVAMWLGTVASIPSGWVICDGNNDTLDLRDKFIKIGADLSENNNTGGSNTHTHASQGHTHTGASHTHSIPGFSHSGMSAGTGNGNDGAGTVPFYYPDVIHDASTSGASNLGLASANTSADSSANQPAYRTAAYIQLNKLGGSASFLLNFI